MFCNTKDTNLQSKNRMLFIGFHVLVVFKSMLVKPIETSLPDLMNTAQKSTSQCTST